MRPAAAHGDAKTLGVAQHDVGVKFTRGHEQCERQQIRRDDERSLLFVRCLRERCQVMDVPEGGWVLRQHGKIIVVFHELRRKAHQHIQTQGFGAGANDFNGLRVHVTGHDEVAALALDAAFGQGHGFGRSGRFV